MNSSEQLTLRPAAQNDCRFVWETNNHPSVRAQAIQSSAIEWESHQRWFTATLADPARQLLVVLFDGTPAGILRFDFNLHAREAVITIALDPEARGKGLGRRAILRGSSTVLGRCEVDKIAAYIRPKNIPSRRAFEASGFKKSGREVIEGVTLERYELKDVTDES